MTVASRLPLANIGIAITRPTDQATKLSQLIQDAGGHVITYPLIAIAPLADYIAFNQVIAHLDDYGWAIFISSNAVQNGMPKMIQQGIPDSLQFAAIGPVTAKELYDFGVQQVLTPLERFDSESLLALPEMQTMQGKKVLIVRGVGGREVLADTLVSRGAQVTFGECYRRINPQNNCEPLTTAWQNNALHAIVVTSSEALRHLIALAGGQPWLKKITLCVNHTRIAEEAHTYGLTAKVADAPGDMAMLKNLLSIYEHAQT